MNKLQTIMGRAGVLVGGFLIGWSVYPTINIGILVLGIAIIGTSIYFRIKDT